MASAHLAIRTVVRRTGLSPHVIRIWEKRYKAVEPERIGTNRRPYSDEHIERLALLRELTQAGHGISRVAKLSTEELREMTKHSASQNGKTPLPSTTDAQPTCLDECIAAVQSLASRRLNETLKRAATELGFQGLLQRVIAPLAQSIGELWRSGSITAAHERFDSAIIRVFLGHAARPFAGT